MAKLKHTNRWFILGFLAAGLHCARSADFPTPFNTENPKNVLTSPADALAKIKAPPGFKVSLLASEPEVQNPIAITTDEKGRLWVAENYTYAESGVSFELRLRDRIVVFEDTKHNGHFDKRTIFWDGAQRLTSIEVGFGGVWALCSPRLVFIPDRNGDLVPDGPPEVVLDGWNDFEVQHNIVNGLKWGPDGWLYGRHGIQANSLVGKPGTPAAQRKNLNCCIWRFHPTRKVFEVVCQGTTNPWGMDWNEVGEAFFINTVIGHLWEVIPGAHYKRMYGEDFNPHVYEMIDQHADHLHWDSRTKWSESRGGVANDFGGGHAHVGLLIYQGGNWPERYRNTLFTVNMHGLRLNNDLLVRSGSGYVGRHTNDFVLFNDPWFRGVEVLGAPDGGAYIADWCDTGECHEHDGVHRTSGRIYEVTYGDKETATNSDISRASDQELAKLQLQENVWFSRQARRLLQERATAGRDLSAAHASLRQSFEQQAAIPMKLRAMWALATSGGATSDWLLKQLSHPSENVRVWALRFLTDEGSVPAPVVQECLRLAREDKSAFVRLALASTLQRLPPQERLALARPLLVHAEDASDHNLPLMYWYGIEPLAKEQPGAFAELEWQTQVPLLRRFIARRITEDIERNPAAVNRFLESAATNSAPAQEDILRGMSEALKGWRKAPKPQAWDTVAKGLLDHPDAQVRQYAGELGVVFGDGRAVDELRRLALDNTAGPMNRRVALESLIASRSPDLLPVLSQLLGDRTLASTAVLGLANFDDPALAGQLLEKYKSFRTEVKPDVIATLVSRASFARPLLEAVAAGKVPRQDISAYNARQIHSLNDSELNKKLAEVWGEFRPASEDKQAKMSAWKSKLTPDRIKAADLQRGHDVFQKNCGVCHRLYGEGAFIGPDLTGSGRSDLGYLLENILDPSAVVGADYKMSIVEMKDDRILTGIVGNQKEHTLTVQTPTEKLVVQREDFQSIRASNFSLMPDGLLDSLSEGEVTDLIAYLMNKQ
jgi:putative membrane-bound dehydrogenase-like protein